MNLKFPAPTFVRLIDALDQLQHVEIPDAMEAARDSRDLARLKAELDAAAMQVQVMRDAVRHRYNVLCAKEGLCQTG